MDPGIFCFIHCGSKIFSLDLPEICPVCQIKINNDFSIMPFRIPCPFKIASRNPCSVVIKPTVGDFLNEYYNSKYLHIGITTSRGFVVEFSDKGLLGVDCGIFTCSVNSQWRQCLIIETADEDVFEYWDNVLLQVCNNMNWVADTYDEIRRNCFTFVLTFLQKLRFEPLSRMAERPRQFCEQYIVPQTTAAGKYISLFRKLKLKSYLIDNNDFTLVS